jgi:hypothetical protein
VALYFPSVGSSYVRRRPCWNACAECRFLVYAMSERALARLGNKPKVGLGRLPAAGIFLFGFLVRYRRHDVTSSPCFQFTGVATLSVAVS